MDSRKADIECSLMVIGTGMAGMAASLFAARRGIDTVQTGLAGQLGFASGMIDVMGVSCPLEGRISLNPWEAIERLHSKRPSHPYCRITISEIRKSVHLLLEFLSETGYPHAFSDENNMLIPTAAGTVKPTYAVPHTMARAAPALAGNEPCLLVSFSGFRGFSSRQIAACLSDVWPGLRPVITGFPESTGELHTERMARSLEAPANIEKLAKAILPHIKEEASVALPAVMGISRTREVESALKEALGVPVFEIPTMVPGVTGPRLLEKFENNLPARGIRPMFHHCITRAEKKPGGGWIFEVKGRNSCRLVSARAALICSGRFTGGGLHADRHRISETIFGLPVLQPHDRSGWHQKDLLAAEGHPVNRAGLDVDDRFRPVDQKGRPVYRDLFAAGSILAGQDWMREKCGSGLAAATAYAAINACSKLLG